MRLELFRVCVEGGCVFAEADGHATMREQTERPFSGAVPSAEKLAKVATDAYVVLRVDDAIDVGARRAAGALIVEETLDDSAPRGRQ